MNKTYYVKSFRAEFDGLQTLIDNQKVTTQTTEEIFQSFIINPNTQSFGWPPRLCSTILDDHYTKTYRPQWLIFELSGDEKPDYIFPFDLNAITENNEPVVEYHSIKDELHLHYNVLLIKDFMQFASDSYEEMVEKFKSPQNTINPDDILHLVNRFRIEQWREPLALSKRKLVEYNEAIFLRPVKVKPVAIYGDNTVSRSLANEYGVPHYTSAQEFYQSTT